MSVSELMNYAKRQFSSSNIQKKKIPVEDTGYRATAGAETPLSSEQQKIVSHFGVKASVLQQAAGEDWQEIATDLDKLAAFADLISRQNLLDHQCVPNDYATLILCRACGVVPGESGEVGRIVLGCPWCHVPNKSNRYLLKQWANRQYQITFNDMKSGGLRRPWKEILASPALLTQLAIETQKIKRFSIR